MVEEIDFVIKESLNEMENVEEEGTSLGNKRSDLISSSNSMFGFQVSKMAKNAFRAGMPPHESQVLSFKH